MCNSNMFLKDIMKRIEEDFLINGKGYIIMPGFELFRDVITLYAKQHNLLESTLLLLENNNTEEAYILTRSLINNYFLIGYILKDENGERINEFHNQPIISTIFQLENMKKVLNDNTFKNLTKEEVEKNKKEINEALRIFKNKRKKRKINESAKPLSIYRLASECDELGFSLYTSMYIDASRYEHSDITSLELYKKKVLEEYSNDYAFILDMSSSNEKLKARIYRVLEIIYLDTFLKIMQYINEKQSHFLSNYNENKLKEIALLIEFRFNKKHSKK